MHLPSSARTPSCCRIEHGGEKSQTRTPPPKNAWGRTAPIRRSPRHTSDRRDSSLVGRGLEPSFLRRVPYPSYSVEGYGTHGPRFPDSMTWPTCDTLRSDSSPSAPSTSRPAIRRLTAEGPLPPQSSGCGGPTRPEPGPTGVVGDWQLLKDLADAHVHDFAACAVNEPNSKQGLPRPDFLQEVSAVARDLLRGLIGLNGAGGLPDGWP